MKKKQVFLLALMMLALFMLCGCGAIQETSISSSGDSVTDLALRPDGEAGHLYENDGLKLMIPLEYDELLITETPQDDRGARLFSVSEKASVEAAKATGMDYEGAGWLFSIERIDEATLRDLLCNTDLSGTEVFARDDLGRYYLYRHPTDVRYVRGNNDAMAADQGTWNALNEWAWSSLPIPGAARAWNSLWRVSHTRAGHATASVPRNMGPLSLQRTPLMRPHGWRSS